MGQPLYWIETRSVVERREWVSFPAGAGSQAYGHLDAATDEVVISGPTTFGSGLTFSEVNC